MSAMFFGDSGRRLFGVYDAPAVAGRMQGVVICQPVGSEYLRAHKACRRLASLLAGAGLHVLRFDYYGTGDSEGGSEAGTLAQWVEDVETAIDELRDSTGIPRVSLVGLRFGGTLAAMAAARRRDVDRLVLWDPSLDGAEYVREQLTAYGRQAPAQPDATQVMDALGMPMTVAQRDALAAVAPATLATGLRVPTTVVTREETAAHRALVGALAATGIAARVDQVDAAPAWIEERDYGIGAMPTAALDHLVRQLT